MQAPTPVVAEVVNLYNGEEPFIEVDEFAKLTINGQRYPKVQLGCDDDLLTSYEGFLYWQSRRLVQIPEDDDTFKWASGTTKKPSALLKVGVPLSSPVHRFVQALVTAAHAQFPGYQVDDPIFVGQSDVGKLSLKLWFEKVDDGIECSANITDFDDEAREWYEAQNGVDCNIVVRPSLRLVDDKNEPKVKIEFNIMRLWMKPRSKRVLVFDRITSSAPAAAAPAANSIASSATVPTAWKHYGGITMEPRRHAAPEPRHKRLKLVST